MSGPGFYAAMCVLATAGPAAIVPIAIRALREAIKR